MSQMPRRYRILLLLSLALNLGLGSALLTSYLQTRQASSVGDERRWARIPDPRALARVLDDADRKVLRQVIDEHRTQLRDHFQPLGQARREMSGVLRTEPFDRQALERAFAGVRTSETETAEAMHRFMLDLAPRLSPDGRQRVAALLERRHQHRHSRRDRDGPADKGAPL